MSESMSRRRALLLTAASFSTFLAAAAAGCEQGDPNQFVSGTLVVPLDSVEKADEIAAKKLEAEQRSKRSRKSPR